MSLTLGGVQFPLVAPALGGSLLSACDPFLAKALPFYQHCINHYCASAFFAAMAGQQVNLTTAACAETTTVDPLQWLGNLPFRFPLLAVYPKSSALQADASRGAPRTGSADLLTNVYEFAYVLPPLAQGNAEQVNRVLPMLQAIRSLLLLVTSAHADPSYSPTGELADRGKNVWTDEELASLSFDGAEYGVYPAPAEGRAEKWPALQGQLTTQVRTGFADARGNPFVGARFALDLGSPEEGSATDQILPDFLTTDSAVG